jgi:(p)ppGpp synthase/HD superfamily hydrolase
MDAMIFAMLKHEGQVRKYTGEPYWMHLATVAGLVSHLGPRAVQIAWLHDVLEDTEATVNEITGHFGIAASSQVMCLTKPGKEGGNRASRLEQYNARLSRAKSTVQSVKVADIISNCTTLRQHDPKFADTYFEEKATQLKYLARADPHLLRMAKAVVY